MKLELRDEASRLVSSNFYWLSTKPDVYDWPKTDYKFTPVTEHGDFTALERLPKADLALTSDLEPRNGRQVVRVRVKNSGSRLAFMVRLRLIDERSGGDILPILWDDNFLSLMPGEEREIAGSYLASDAPGATPVVLVEGVNIATLRVTPRRQ